MKGLEPLKVQGREKELEVALFDIRGAMMMDYNQAEKVKNNKGAMEIDESFDATKKRFDAMLANPKMETLLTNMGLTKEDYASVLQKGGEGKRLTLSGVKEGYIAAVASLKSTNQYMAHMPSGTVRVAMSGDKEFSKEISDSSMKTKIFDTAVPAGSLTEKSYMAGVANVLGITGTSSVSRDQLKDLFVGGRAQIAGREVNMQ
jgi:hypothetical protein